MSENSIEITCIRCGHTWCKDLSQLGKVQRVIYKGTVELRSYRVSCPQCGCVNIVTVEVEEDEDDQG